MHVTYGKACQLISLSLSFLIATTQVKNKLLILKGTNLNNYHLFIRIQKDTLVMLYIYIYNLYIYVYNLYIYVYIYVYNL